MPFLGWVAGGVEGAWRDGGGRLTAWRLVHHDPVEMCDPKADHQSLVLDHLAEKSLLVEPFVEGAVNRQQLAARVIPGGARRPVQLGLAVCDHVAPEGRARD